MKIPRIFRIFDPEFYINPVFLGCVLAFFALYFNLGHEPKNRLADRVANPAKAAQVCLPRSQFFHDNDTKLLPDGLYLVSDTSRISISYDHQPAIVKDGELTPVPPLTVTSYVCRVIGGEENSRSLKVVRTKWGPPVEEDVWKVKNGVVEVFRP